MSGRTRVGWRPGSDLLHGWCHCGAQADAEDPVLLWEWLAAHPAHPHGGARLPEPPRALPPAPPHLVTDPALIRRRATAPA
jgi:hypothetical protein